jgi:hypothetical protein
MFHLSWSQIFTHRAPLGLGGDLADDRGRPSSMHFRGGLSSISVPMNLKKSNIYFSPRGRQRASKIIETFLLQTTI